MPACGMSTNIVQSVYAFIELHNSEPIFLKILGGGGGPHTPSRFTCIAYGCAVIICCTVPQDVW